MNGGKYLGDTNSDFTNLRSTIDSRFTRLEKTVEKIHNEFKLKMFDGFAEGAEPGGNASPVQNQRRNFNRGNPNESLSLVLDKEVVIIKAVENKQLDTQWNDLLHDSNTTPVKITQNAVDDGFDFDENYPKIQLKKFDSNDNILNQNDIKIRINTNPIVDNHINTKTGIRKN